MNTFRQTSTPAFTKVSSLSLRIWSQFREFIMLFLAVFCGFLAENYREEQQEEEVALGYLKSMMLDLERDSVQLERMISLTKRTFANADSLKQELLTSRIETDCRPSYQWLFKTFGFDDFAPNDGTMEQLKHSGSLRFIKEKPIVDAIMNYQGSHTPLRVHEATMNNLLEEVVKLRQNFDLIQLHRTGFSARIPLLKNGKEDRNYFFERVEVWLLYLERLEVLQRNVVKEGTGLKMEILKHHPKIMHVD